MNMTYGIAKAPSTFKLQQLVNEMIQQGWILCGGVCTAPINHSYLREGPYHDINVEYLQAIVKMEKLTYD